MDLLTLAPEVDSVLHNFADLFMQVRSWEKAQLLLVGSLLCRGKRTVSRVLQMMGLSDEPHYINYHRLLSRTNWSARQAAQKLLSLLLCVFVGHLPIVIGLDDTLERRWGRRIWGRGIYRDAVRSTAKYSVKCSGLKWVVMQVIVPLPWSKRPWAMPFFTVLAPSKASNQEAGIHHKTTVDWAIQMVSQVSRWLQCSWICVADGGYGGPKFGWACRRQGVRLISRIRWDAKLYDFAPCHNPHRRGRIQRKGFRLPSLRQRLEQIQQQHPTLAFSSLLPGLNPTALHDPIVASLRWYGNTTVVRHLYTGTALWYVDGHPPMPLRWVIVIDPKSQQPPAALFSTDLSLSPSFIVETFVSRWSLEVTFEEVRAHLGFQTQRHWSKKATQRTTPVILALFSITCLISQQLQKSQLWMPRKTAWYAKTNLTFSDLLEQVRTHLWQAHPYFARSFHQTNPDFFDSPQGQQLMALLASSF